MNKIKLILSILIIAFCMLTGYTQQSAANCGSLVHYENFASTNVAPRNIDIWLPNGYTPTKKYAVLYMHDGQMLFDSTITWNKQEWHIDETLTRLLNGNVIQDCIVVGVWNNGAYRHSEYFPEKPLAYLPSDVRDTLIKNELEQTPQSDAYLKFLVNELKPFVDSNYSTLTDKAHTFISGSSMGGLISVYAICEYPEIFGGAACLSTHWPGSMHVEKGIIPNAFIKYLKHNLPSPKDHKLYFDFGTATLDQYYEPYQSQVDNVMRKKHFDSTNWMTQKFEGEPHTEDAWSKRFYIPITFLLGK